jgi:serine/threonine-protein kinase RsbT
MSWAGEFEVPIVVSRVSGDRVGSTIGTGQMAEVRVTINADTDIIVARQRSRALALSMKFSTTDSAFIATTVSELARALLSHSVRGEIWVSTVENDGRVGLVVVARDPCMRDWTDGTHRAFTIHRDLPDVYRLVDEFDISTEAGQGTTIRAIKWRRQG